MLSVVAIVLASYVVLRLVGPLRLSWPVRSALALLVYGLALHHRIVARFAGSMASPELPKLVIATLGTGFIALLLTAVFVLVLDAVTLLARVLRRRGALARLRAPGPRPAAAALALLLALYGTWQAMAVPKVRQVEIAIDGLPAAFEGYRVLQLTDIHASRLLTGDWVADVVAAANAQQPDLVVITGDLVDGSVEARADDVRPLAGLRASDGVVAITGNHEYYAQYRAWMDAFRALGMQVLENTHLGIARGDAVLTIAGVTDPVAERYGLPGPDLDAALAGAPPQAPVILLDHRPVAAREAASRGVALQLSGHTHGGHITGMHRLVARANGGFVSGLYRVAGMQLYVSNGAGLWPGFATRIGVPSEITVLTLRRAPG
ncbi:metallophosphoesterase [Luteimonas chenhongjianii]|uniref:Metallophosphoesterase n=1 Tax=Luteimonas chenhongjianii TaxID=2006110 RepID=A0A290XE19_9GAMM|nr:metallophosphoesterase [Luteimonas chenhongjianii]ATD67258.1 metallophosphoesterase [Luteimonas chenhongjianii]